MGNAEGEIWDALLGKRNGLEKWGCILGDVPGATRSVALLDAPKYFASKFSRKPPAAPFCFKTADCHFKRDLNSKKGKKKSKNRGQINQNRNRNIFKIRRERLCVVIKIAHISIFLFLLS